MATSKDDRQDQIFELIVESYIDSAEPVGSRTLSKISRLGLSPASIRNVMADLEEIGYLTHPHTSAGRIPTDSGYRYYVDAIMELKEVEDAERLMLRRQIETARTLETLAHGLSKMMSEMTDHTAMVVFKGLRRVSVISLLMEELIAQSPALLENASDESELVIEGLFRLLNKPEFSDARLLSKLFYALENKSDLIEFLYQDDARQQVRVTIGDENDGDIFERMSVVSKECTFNNTPVACVAVVGPTRMNYSKIVPIVDLTATLLNDALRGY